MTKSDDAELRPNLKTADFLQLVAGYRLRVARGVASLADARRLISGTLIV